MQIQLGIELVLLKGETTKEAEISLFCLLRLMLLGIVNNAKLSESRLMATQNYFTLTCSEQRNKLTLR